jgi:hypothetical protein
MRLTSEFAIISIEGDRSKLAKHFAALPREAGPCPENLRIPITIVGYLDGVWGKDDGIDQEFTVAVTSVS